MERMGSDKSVIDCARISYGSESDGGPKDEALIKLLMDKGHLTPFESIYFRFKVRCPIFVARQWMRHRLGSYNEKSARYTKIDSFYIPPYLSYEDQQIVATSTTQSLVTYNNILDKGIRREVARMILPVNSMTEFFWTVNFRTLMNFITLRIDPHAQREIRDCAHGICVLIEPLIPLSYKTYVERNTKLNKEAVDAQNTSSI